MLSMCVNKSFGSPQNVTEMFVMPIAIYSKLTFTRVLINSPISEHIIDINNAPE